MCVLCIIMWPTDLPLHSAHHTVCAVLQPDSGRTALHHAAKEGHAAIVRLLIKHFKASVEKADVRSRVIVLGEMLC